MTKQKMDRKNQLPLVVDNIIILLIYIIYIIITYFRPQKKTISVSTSGQLVTGQVWRTVSEIVF